MNDETPIDYIDVMARWLLIYAYEAWVEEGWESVPEIGEHDYDRICTRIEKMLPKSPTMTEYQEAYNTLEVRAAAVEEDKNPCVSANRDHEWVSGDNEHVSGAEVCIHCRTIRAAYGEDKE